MCEFYWVVSAVHLLLGSHRESAGAGAGAHRRSHLNSFRKTARRPGEKFVVFYNPPVVNKALGIRRGYLNETRRIARELLERGQQTLVFANSRLATEILLTYLKDDRPGSFAGGSVRGYRGGYLPKERREIERKLREGEIRAVVATNALELGIDIGSLDAQW